MTKITATFHDTAVTRETDAAYTHASRRNGVVRFHTTEVAARREVGRYGEVVRTDFVADAPAAKTTATWRVRFEDGTTHDVATDVPPVAMTAARDAFPDKVVTGASKVSR